MKKHIDFACVAPGLAEGPSTEFSRNVRTNKPDARTKMSAQIREISLRLYKIWISRYNNKIELFTVWLALYFTDRKQTDDRRKEPAAAETEEKEIEHGIQRRCPV